VKAPLLRVASRELDSELTVELGLARAEALMHELVGSCNAERGARMAREHLGSGGKRLRARLALAATVALGGLPSHAVVWAAAVELLHNATLVHDDIQDGDRYRRGHPTLWTTHGTAQAINAGDLMLMLPYVAVARLPASLAASLSAALAGAAVHTVRGQISELDLLGSELFDWSSYRRAIAGKAGALVALPVRGAAILAAHPSGEALADEFAELGVLFQLQDDVLDLYGDKGRERAASDLFEGKVSALVVAHLERRPSDRAWLRELLCAPRHETSVAEVRRAVAAFVESGALAITLARIDELAARARDSALLAEVPALRRVALELVDLATRLVEDARRLPATTSARGMVNQEDGAEQQDQSA
jgi:geranylgeranyl diphosphate synthase, type I